jgi:hypothetical protein
VLLRQKPVTTRGGTGSLRGAEVVNGETIKTAGTAPPESQDPEQARAAHSRHGTSGNKWAVFLVLVAMLVGLTCLIVGPPLNWFLRDSHRIDEQRQWLLHKVDHAAVRSAARRMMVDDSLVFGASPFLMRDDPALPPEIGELRPSSVHLTSDKVAIEFGGGFHHYGLAVLPEGLDVSRPPGYAYTKLSEGIWFYEEVE